MFISIYYYKINVLLSIYKNAKNLFAESDLCRAKILRRKLLFFEYVVYKYQPDFCVKFHVCNICDCLFTGTNVNKSKIFTKMGLKGSVGQKEPKW